ncbi:superoxide dismutase [Govanella unica]|uniref:superoxide dismutase n=1 Tax=Govanella unica TaxID=2975056 RepID=A0A9X3Z6X0_9PROT|nr:Fe-Mn family superoxide dismutase [Govania unica]MDA5193561.1 Fe-Mn family superoxide dismutase [Govania unica]
MNDVTRRDALRTAAGVLGATATISAGGVAMAQTPNSSPPAILPPAFAATHEPRPLPFDPARLDGLSERLIKSHWENNYIGSVKALNMIEKRLAAALRDPDLPPIVYGDLKREELNRTGSLVLHEHYFGNLGGNGKTAGAIVTALDAAYGSLANWEAEFRRTAMSLAGGSGWCILGFNLHTRTLHNHWAADHMHNASAAVPLLVLDMYEHSFQMDYGAAAAKYVDAFMRNVNWEEVDRRYARSMKMAAL